MNIHFEKLDQLISEIQEIKPYRHDSGFISIFMVNGENSLDSKNEKYPGNIKKSSRLENECIREINEYFDEKEAENNSSYGAILDRMHKINTTIDELSLTTEKDKLKKLFHEDKKKFSKWNYRDLKGIDAAENCVEQINARFNLLKIDVNNLKNAVDEAYTEIDIKKTAEIVLLLERLGIFDFLRQKLFGISNNQLGLIFGKVTKTKPDSFSKAVGRLSDKTPNTKAEEKIDQFFKKLKLPIVGK